jgi:hypothetical protein
VFKRYGFFRNPRYSSLPAELTAPNGINFVKSVGNPNSRLEKVRKYLSDNGPRTKREILRDVFGKEIGDLREHWMTRRTKGHVTHGWGAYLWTYGVRHGFFTKTRKGNTTLWSLAGGSLSQADGVA